MTQIKMEDIVMHLDEQMKNALVDTMKTYAPYVTYDVDSLYKHFAKRVYYHCRTWEPVPDDTVRIQPDSDL